MRKLCLAITALALAVAGCGGSDDGGGSSGAKSGEPVSITLWHGQNQTAGKTINALVDKFNESHPKIKVDAQIGTVADGLLEKTTAALAGGEYPDVVYQFGPNVANLARSPKAVDLTEDVKDPSWNWDDFFPAARDAVTVDGKIRAIPALIDSLAVVYNKKLFKQAGIEPPKAGWTWDDYRSIAQKLTDSSKGTFGTAWPGVGDEDAVWRIWPMVWSAGGDVLDESGDKVGYDGESGERALETIRAMAVDDKSVYIDKTYGSEKMYSVFNNNRMGMIPTGPWELPEIIDSKIDYGVVPMPTFGGGEVTISGPDTWMLFDNGKAKVAAAKEFVKWLTQPEQDAVWDVKAGSLPLRASTAKQTVWTDHVKEIEGLQVFVDVLENARVRPTIQNYPKLSLAMGKAITSVLLGQATADEALQRAVDGGNAAAAKG
jgi:multiple sugar transport system substrate-binding protein